MKISGLFPKEREGRTLCRPPAESRRGVLARGPRKSGKRREENEEMVMIKYINNTHTQNGFIKEEEDEEQKEGRLTAKAI